jgi:ComF family protein
MSTIGSWLLHRCAGVAGSALPQDCLLCGAASDDTPLCGPCRDELPALPRGCPLCAMPTPLGEICGACRRQPPPFDRTVAVWRYAYPVDRLVRSLKFHGRLALASFFAEALASALARTDDADVVIPMPLHTARLAERGFNQAAEIARRLTGRSGARTPGPRLALQGARRIRRTLPQTDLAFDERLRNVRGAFACALDLAGARVAVVDDVMTTGATLVELAKVLKRAGAARVENWVVARTFE